MWVHHIGLFGLAILATVLTLQCASSKSIGPNETEHYTFFRKLDDKEKLGLMNLAIMYHDADGLVVPKPSPIDAVPRSDNLIASTPPEIEVPQSLVSHFLNGHVPTDWQKEFTTWLKKDLNMTYGSFESYKQTGKLCSATGECRSLDNIGGICCPFG